MLELAIDGTGWLPSAKASAARQLQKHGGSADGAIDGIVDFHVGWPPPRASSPISAGWRPCR